MVNRSRQLNPTPPKRGQNTPQQWRRLLQKAIQMAKTVGDTRKLRMLQKALQEDKARQVLRKLSIICEADLQREFGR